MTLAEPTLSEPFTGRERAILERIALGAKLEELLEDIVRLVEDQAPGMLCSILLLDEPAGRLRHGAAPSLPAAYASAIDGAAIGPSVGSCGTAAFTKKRVIVESIADDPLWAGFKGLALPHGLRACWSTPILSAAGAVLGTFAMYYRERRGPRAEELAWVGAATHLAAIAIVREQASSALRASEARARQLAWLYAVSNSVDDAILRVRDAQSLYDAACRIAVEHGLARLAWVGVYSAGTDRIVPVARHGEDRGYVDTIALGVRDATGQGPAARALATGVCAISNDIENDASFFWKEEALSRGLRSCAVFPLTVSGKTLGVLALYADRTEYFHDEEQRVLTALAKNIAFAVESASVERERQKLVVALKRSEEQLRAVIEHTPNVAIQWYDDDGRLLFCNRASEMLLGTTAAAAQGKTLAELGFPAEESARFTASIRRIAATGEAVGPLEFRYRRPDGTNGTLLSTIFAIPYGDGGRCYVCMDVDLTESKRAEERRRELEVQLQKARRIEALGTLAGGIAHDFKNVLTAIAGNAELGLKEGATRERRTGCLHEIRKAAERGSDLVKRLLTVGQREEPQRAAVDVTAIAAEAVGLLRATLPENVEIATDFSADAPNAVADPSQLHQVVMNLGTNAVHALEPKGGRIEVAVTREERAVAADVPAGTYVRLRIRDNGCGMDAATRQRIFEPFFTTKEAGKGTGLGLPMVYRIVKAHGGAIAVESVPGQGTTFDLTLPATDARPERTAAETGGEGGAHILYVDDEDALVYLMKRALEDFGYRVTTHTDPERAVGDFRARPADFTAVVSDVNMHGMSGLELARAVRALRADVPVVLTSGYPRQEIVEAARAIGVRDVILKPSTVDELGAALHRAIAPAPH